MIYFDNSATTKINADALKTYQIVSDKFWGNPSSLHSFGAQAHNLLAQSRQEIADLLHVKPNEILFTSGGTEGDNWSIKGTALAKRKFGNHIITTSVEHAAVYNSMHTLEKLGFDVTYLPVDKYGRISLDDLKAAIRPTTILVSVMAVNNEIGTIEPIKKIADLLKHYPKINFHVDAVQAVGKGLEKQIINGRTDFAVVSGHKFHAPRGTGFIYAREGRRFAPLIDGGGQEFGMRSGTENLPGIAAMAKALRLDMTNENAKVKKQREIKACLYEHLQKFPKVRIFSQNDDSFAPHILCFAIDGVRGETVVHAFEEQGIYISTTSACSSQNGEPSHTLSAIGISGDVSDGSVRISLGDQNTMAEARQFNKVFDKLYQKFSKLSD